MKKQNRKLTSHKSIKWIGFGFFFHFYGVYELMDHKANVFFKLLVI